MVDRTVITVGLKSLIVPAEVVAEVEVVVVVVLCAVAKLADAKRPARMTAVKFLLVVFFMVNKISVSLDERNGVKTPYSPI